DGGSVHLVGGDEVGRLVPVERPAALLRGGAGLGNGVVRQFAHCLSPLAVPMANAARLCAIGLCPINGWLAEPFRLRGVPCRISRAARRGPCASGPDSGAEIGPFGVPDELRRDIGALRINR